MMHLAGVCKLTPNKHSDHLYYYDNEANYKKGKDYLGVIALNAYYCGVDTNTDTKHGFQVSSQQSAW